MPPNAVDHYLPDGTMVEGEWRAQMALLDPLMRDPQRNATHYCKHVRSTLADYFLTLQGELPWQYDSD